MTFVDEADPQTKVTFPHNGRYRLALTVTNPASRVLQDIAALGVLVNQPPQIDAGPDQIVNLPATADLDGTVSDDGLPDPPGKVQHQWTKIAGPGDVAFENSRNDCTSATFSTKGIYSLQLSAFDGQDMTIDQLEVIVNQAPLIHTEAVVRTTPNQPATLLVEIKDDGLGNPVLGKVTVEWQPAGDGLILKDPSALQAEATSTERGRYPVDLTVSNGFLSTTTQVHVAVFDLPMVKAGDGGIVLANEAVSLNGQVLDNGLGQADADGVSLRWELASGPATPKFSDPFGLAGTVRFPVKGDYLLRLTADNGFFQSSDAVSFTVNQELRVDAGIKQIVRPERRSPCAVRYSKRARRYTPSRAELPVDAVQRAAEVKFSNERGQETR